MFVRSEVLEKEREISVCTFTTRNHYDCFCFALYHSNFVSTSFPHASVLSNHLVTSTHIHNLEFFTMAYCLALYLVISCSFPDTYTDPIHSPILPNFSNFKHINILWRQRPCLALSSVIFMSRCLHIVGNVSMLSCRCVGACSYFPIFFYLGVWCY